MKTMVLVIIPALLGAVNCLAQQPPPYSFGGFYNATSEVRDEISLPQREKIQTQIKKNIRELHTKGVLPQANKTGSATKFIFPLRQADGFNAHGFYGISNYVDLDSTAGIKDFNCLRRTYDGHMGTDYFTVPFPWQKMDENAVEIVAAADGIIVGKEGSMADTSCSMCPVGAPPNCWYWNAVYLQHPDGTLTMYGHMKANSLTSKEFGESVKAGEFLGVVGSSGNSTGPHLHFEVWTDTFFSKRIDPWAGNCNYTTDESYWTDQPSYYVDSIFDVITGSKIPVPFTCYENGEGEKSFAKDTFSLGETVYFTSFVRDNRPNGTPYHLKLIDPDNVVRFDWYLNPFAAYYPSAYFYYYWGGDVINKPGEWKFYVGYASDSLTKSFYVQDVLPLKLTEFTASAIPGKVMLEWKTTEEINTDFFEIERSGNSRDFKSIGTVKSRGVSKGTNNYKFLDESPPFAENFYRLRMVDLDGEFTYSPVRKAVKGSEPVMLFPNPAGDIVTLTGVNRYRRVRISDINGVIVFSQTIGADKVDLNISRLKPGLYLLQLGNDSFELSLKLIKN